MPSYPADSVVHQISEHSCAAPGCRNSKLRGSPMRLCNQCKMVYYCSAECQKTDWGLHKVPCKSQAAQLRAMRETGVATLGEDFDAWKRAIGPHLFIRSCVHGA
ncbi:hypothetical protein C8R44DRAFT_803709 [Mycena epipterygia]|nr:hypothetical protein C8R44DRAFT_803709 [Mycena epipterygia]